MPLAKHKSGKLKHILCDVFLLLLVFQTSLVTGFPGKSHDLDALTEGGAGNTIPYNVIESILRDQNVPSYNSEVGNSLRSLRRRKRSIETSTNAATSPEDEVTTTTSTTGSPRVLLNKITNSLKIAKPDDNAENIDTNNLREIYINSTEKSDVKVFLNSTNNNIVNLTITTTTRMPLSVVEKFQELSFRNKSIRSLTEICGNTSEASLTTLPSGLEVVDLSENHIAQYDGGSSSSCWKNVKRLNLSRNHLSGIYKDTFSGLFNLNTLILSHNNISFIDYDGFMRSSNLEYLDLSFNQLDGNSTRSLQNIRDLVGLSIAYNERLGESLQDFVTSWSLQQIDASGTGLCKIPAALAQSVKALKLRDNWLQTIRCGDLESYPLLEYLDLSHSHINEIEDDTFGRLEILETLFLDNNNLKSIPSSLPTSLEHLFLQNNEIAEVQSQVFLGLHQLKILDLSNNQIMYLPDLPLPKLETLNLQYSGVHSLSPFIVSTSPDIRELLLDGNPIKCSELLGMAEWASPCQNKLPERKDIKKDFLARNHEIVFGTIDGALEVGQYPINVKPECAKSPLLPATTPKPPTKTKNNIELLPKNNEDKEKSTTPRNVEKAKEKEKRNTSHLYKIEEIDLKDRHLLGTPLLVNTGHILKESKELMAPTYDQKDLYFTMNEHEHGFHEIHQINNKKKSHDKIITNDAINIDDNIEFDHNSIKDIITNDDLDVMMKTDDYNGIKEKISETHHGSTSTETPTTNQPKEDSNRNINHHHSINVAILQQPTTTSILPSSTTRTITTTTITQSPMYSSSDRSITESKHEQWLEIRTEANGHPGLFIVIGLTFSGILILGLVQMYRCNYNHHYRHRHNHWNNSNNEQDYVHHLQQQSLHLQQEHHLSHHNQYNGGNSLNMYERGDNDYYIEMQQPPPGTSEEVVGGVGVCGDFLPMELLSPPRHSSPIHIVRQEIVFNNDGGSSNPLPNSSIDCDRNNIIQLECNNSKKNNNNDNVVLRPSRLDVW
ncbi:hypothetical protein ACFFRR_007093 [Megaselia abdita]